MEMKIFNLSILLLSLGYLAVSQDENRSTEESKSSENSTEVNDTTPDIVSTTARTLTPYSFYGCCGNPALDTYVKSRGCRKKCSHQADFRRWFRRNPLGMNACRDHFRAYMVCGNGGRDNGPCCTSRGMDPDCLIFCRVGPDTQPREMRMPVSRGIKCVSKFTAIAWSCMRDNLALIPTPPTNIRAEDITMVSLVVLWDDVPSHSPIPDNFTVEYRMSGLSSGTWNEIVIIGHSVFLDKFHPGSTVEVRIRSNNKNGHSLFSKRRAFKLKPATCSILKDYQFLWLTKRGDSQARVTIAAKLIMYQNLTHPSQTWSASCVINEDVSIQDEEVPVLHSVFLLKSQFCYRCMVISAIFGETVTNTLLARVTPCILHNDFDMSNITDNCLEKLSHSSPPFTLNRFMVAPENCGPVFPSYSNVVVYGNLGEEMCSSPESSLRSAGNVVSMRLGACANLTEGLTAKYHCLGKRAVEEILFLKGLDHASGFLFVSFVDTSFRRDRNAKKFRCALVRRQETRFTMLLVNDADCLPLLIAPTRDVLEIKATANTSIGVLQSDFGDFGFDDFLNENQSSPVFTTRSSEKPLFTTRSSERPLSTNRSSERPFFTTRFSEQPFFTTRSSEEPFSTTRSSEKPFSTTGSSEKPLFTTQSSGEPLSTARSSGEPLSTTRSSGEPLSTTRSSGEPLSTTRSSEQPLSTTRSSEQPRSTTRSSEELLPTTRSSEEPLPTTRSSEEPLSTTRSSEEPLSTTRSSEEPLSTTRSSGEPLSTTQSSEQPLPTTRSSEKPLSTTRSSEQPLPTTRSSEEPLPTTRSSEKPLSTTRPSEKPISTNSHPSMSTTESTDFSSKNPKATSASSTTEEATTSKKIDLTSFSPHKTTEKRRTTNEIDLTKPQVTQASTRSSKNPGMSRGTTSEPTMSTKKHENTSFSSRLSTEFTSIAAPTFESSIADRITEKKLKSTSGKSTVMLMTSKMSKTTLSASITSKKPDFTSKSTSGGTTTSKTRMSHKTMRRISTTEAETTKTSATTKTQTQAPLLPPPKRILVTFTGVDQMILEWREVPGAVAYVIEYGLHAVDVPWIEVRVHRTRVMLQGLFPGGLYSVRVYTVDSSEKWSVASSMLTVKLKDSDCSIPSIYWGRWYSHSSGFDTSAVITEEVIVRRNGSDIWSGFCILSKNKLRGDQSGIESTLVVFRGSLCFRCFSFVPFKGAPAALMVTESGCMDPEGFSVSACSHYALTPRSRLYLNEHYTPTPCENLIPRTMQFKYSAGKETGMCQGMNFIKPSSVFAGWSQLLISFSSCQKHKWSFTKRLSLYCVGLYSPKDSDVNIAALVDPTQSISRYRFRCLQVIHNFMGQVREVSLTNTADCFKDLYNYNAVYIEPTGRLRQPTVEPPIPGCISSCVHAGKSLRDDRYSLCDCCHTYAECRCGILYRNTCPPKFPVWNFSSKKCEKKPTYAGHHCGHYAAMNVC